MTESVMDENELPREEKSGRSRGYIEACSLLDDYVICFYCMLTCVWSLLFLKHIEPAICLYIANMAVKGICLS